jgi:hypothetical protein
MVLQPTLALARLGACLVLAACSRGPAPSNTTPPSTDGSAVAVEPPRDRAQPAASGAAAAGDAPACEDPGGGEELYIDGVTLRLQPSSCTLTAVFLDQTRQHRFEGFPGACHFARDGQDQPWVVATDHGNAVLVQASVPAEGGDCDTALQVVVVTERGPALSREIQRVTGCGPGPWDELMLHVLASDRVALGGAER